MPAPFQSAPVSVAGECIGDISLSGAEYNPDIPLQGLIINIDSKFSLMENDTIRSHQIISLPDNEC